MVRGEDGEMRKRDVFMTEGQALLFCFFGILAGFGAKGLIVDVTSDDHFQSGCIPVVLAYCSSAAICAPGGQNKTTCLALKELPNYPCKFQELRVAVAYSDVDIPSCYVAAESVGSVGWAFYSLYLLTTLAIVHDTRALVVARATYCGGLSTHLGLGVRAFSVLALATVIMLLVGLRFASTANSALFRL